MTTPIKQAIRSEFLEARRRIKRETAKAANGLIAQNLLKLIPSKGAVAGYVATRSEIGVEDALVQLHRRGQEIALPMIVKLGQPLEFRRWQPGVALQKGAHGIDIPPISEPEVLPDIVIVPLVAFDRVGHRLGYGAGYYDRTIAWLREAKKNVLIVGAAYSIQLAPTLPSEAHDQKLDAVVTEKAIVRFT